MAERSMWGPPFCSAFDPSDKAEASLDLRLRCTRATAVAGGRLAQ